MRIRFLKSIRLILITLLFSFLLVGCGNLAKDDNELTGADFGNPAEAEGHDHDAHEHDEPEQDDHAHDEEGHEPVFDPSLTETDEEGVFIDHHGNRVVDELYQKFEQDGTQIEFTVENFLGVGGRGGEVTADIRAGERAVVKFRISDAGSGEVVTGLRPLAWMDLQSGEHVEGNHEEQETVCRDKTEGYLSGMLTARPTVDLNGFFILALNDDASISVIDPTVNVSGMTQLFALIQLTGPGQDWALSGDQETLWVTIPSQDQVAIAELDGFSLAKHVDGGPNPMRIVFQPDQRYVWVGNDVEQGTGGGVTVLHAETREIVTRIPTGGGAHEIAFSADSRYAFITNGAAGTLSVIDTEALETVEEIAVGQSPIAVAVSRWNGSIYVADAASGSVFVLDGEKFEPVAQIATEPGMSGLAFAPDGRWAFVANPVAGTIHVIDVETNRRTHSAQVEGAPDQISFSEQAAYIRALNANGVYVISLEELDPDGELELATVPVGNQAPGQFPSPSLAGAVGSANRQGAMVIANPADDQVYFLPEGATGTSGSFQGHTLRPRAVAVIDRSLREEVPGVYTGRVRIPESGAYLVAFMLGDPFVVHCFEFSASPGENVEETDTGQLELTMLEGTRGATVGEPTTLRFQLTESESGNGVDGLTDVTVVASLAAGNWNDRLLAQGQGEGVYEVNVTLPRPGLYTLFFAVPSLRASVDQLPFINLQVTSE